MQGLIVFFLICRFVKRDCATFVAALERKYSPFTTKSVRRYTNHAGPVPFSKKDFYYFIAYESLCSGRLAQPASVDQDWLVDKCASARALLPLIKIYERRRAKHFSHPSDAKTDIAFSLFFFRSRFDCRISRHQLTSWRSIHIYIYDFRIKWEFTPLCIVLWQFSFGYLSTGWF